jgi:hypothetical protein
LKFLVDDENDGKTYHAFARLYLAPDLLTSHKEKLELKADNPVPVLEDSKTVGAADIWYDDQGDLCCDLFFDYASQARLTAQIEDAVYAIPAVNVYIERFGGKSFICINRINLSRKGPEYARLRPHTPKA